MRAVAEQLWEETRTVSIRGVARMGHRMTVIRGADGLTLHSPVELDEALVARIDALGPVRRVVAPSLMHDLFLSPWIERYPEARFLAPPGFDAAHAELPASESLPAAALAADLSAHPVDGMPKVREYAILHAPSRSLIVADLVFNLQTLPDLRSRLVMWLNGAWRRTGPSRLFRMFVQDRAALRASVDRLLELDFDRIVPGHGEIVETGGREALADAFDWLV